MGGLRRLWGYAGVSLHTLPSFQFVLLHGVRPSEFQCSHGLGSQAVTCGRTFVGFAGFWNRLCYCSHLLPFYNSKLVRHCQGGRSLFLDMEWMRWCFEPLFVSNVIVEDRAAP